MKAFLGFVLARLSRHTRFINRHQFVKVFEGFVLARLSRHTRFVNRHQFVTVFEGFVLARLSKHARFVTTGIRLYFFISLQVSLMNQGPYAQLFKQQ
jgi:hypothetical protein